MNPEEKKFQKKYFSKIKSNKNKIIIYFQLTNPRSGSHGTTLFTSTTSEHTEQWLEASTAIYKRYTTPPQLLGSSYHENSTREF